MVLGPHLFQRLALKERSQSSGVLLTVVIQLPPVSVEGGTGAGGVLGVAMVTNNTG